MRFLVDGLQVWASYLDENNNRPFGVRFLWTEDALDCGPQKHITDDGGYTCLLGGCPAAAGPHRQA